MPPPPLFIFEMANNHMGDVAHGLRIIRELKEACAGFPFRFAVKLQYRQLPDFIHPEFRTRKDVKFVKRFSETALSWEQLRELKEAIAARGFLSACTPFDEASVDKIVEHGFDYLKVPSCGLTDWPLAEKIATTNLPLILSTAGESFEDIDRVVSFYQHRNKRLAVLHCVGEYPTPDAGLELNQIDLLRRRYLDVEVGYSTHESPDEFEAVMMAVAKGATVFEKHAGVPTEKYPLNAYSATPAQIRRWLEAAQRAFAMTGVAGRRHDFSPRETGSLGELRRAVFARRAIAAGEVIRKADVFLAIPGRPGQLAARDLSKYTEFRAAKPYAVGEPVMRSGVTATDTRSIVHAVVRQIKKLLKDSGVAVPSQLELEISHHYGLERFHEVGSAMITVVNRDYCKRLVLMLPGQSHPEHWHRLKDETFHLLHGSIELVLDGEKRTCHRNDVVTIQRGAKHAFTTSTGAVIEEISSTHSRNDSCYTDPGITLNADRKTYVTNWMD
jgi:sialic acid synthase SpsE/quercetin dioxygenase-like cupin family protein